MSVKWNVAANFAGHGWRTLMSFAFVPVYIAYLGVEAYGIIGLYVTFQACLNFLDFGIRPMIAREMGRYRGGAHDTNSIADLLRSTEVLALLVAITFAGLVWVISGWLASEWVRPGAIPADTIAKAFVLMGVVAALQFMESLYAGAIAGLQHQVLQNAIQSAGATLRALGALAALAFVSPTLDAYFTWQCIASALTTLMFMAALRHLLPRAERRARFSWAAIQDVKSFMGGMTGIALLLFLMSHTDKILLSRQLPLAEFAHYMLASLVSGSLSLFTMSIGSAFFPRFSELVAKGEAVQLSDAFHLAAQIMSVLIVCAGGLLIFFGAPLLQLWLGDAALARDVAPILSLIAVGTVCHSFFSVLYIFKLAHGWTSLGVKTNLVAFILLIPALIFIVPAYGALGAAALWAIWNFLYLVTIASFMFARLIGDQKWNWAVHDVLKPVTAGTCVALLLMSLMPGDPGPVLLVLAGIAMLIAAGLSANLVRGRVIAALARRPAALPT